LVDEGQSVGKTRGISHKKAPRKLKESTLTTRSKGSNHTGSN